MASNPPAFLTWRDSGPVNDSLEASGMASRERIDEANYRYYALDDPTLTGLFAAGHADGHLQTPDEIGDLVVFLASDASRSLNGALLTCDGGWTSFKRP